MKAQNRYSKYQSTSPQTKNRFYVSWPIMLVGVTGQLLLLLVFDILLRGTYQGNPMNELMKCLGQIIAINGIAGLTVWFVCWLIKLAKKEWPKPSIPTIVLCMFAYLFIVGGAIYDYQKKYDIGPIEYLGPASEEEIVELKKMK